VLQKDWVLRLKMFPYFFYTKLWESELGFFHAVVKLKEVDLVWTSCKTTKQKLTFEK
jgi:hypothetical protein